MSIKKGLFILFFIAVAIISYFITSTRLNKKNISTQQEKNTAINENYSDSINYDKEIQKTISDDEIVKISEYIPDVVEDVRYATTNNFTGKAIYEDSHAYLRYGTVKKLINVQNELKGKGYKLVVWDAYRPVSAQYKLWEAYPDAKYVANPNNGYSSHNRGNTIDISIVKIDGSEVNLPSGYDDFTEKADRDYSDVSNEAKNNAELLEKIMEKHGFKGYEKEWWHYTDTVNYDVV